MAALDEPTLFTLAPPAAPRLEIHRDAYFSDDGRFRWWLKRWWRAGPYVLWIMLNPSTADAEKDDPTVKRVIGFTQRWGYAGLMIVNLFPFVSSHPRELIRWLGTEEALRICALNALMLEAEGVKNAAVCIAAWGASVAKEHGTSLAEVVKDFPCFGGLHHLGLTQDGFPKHPLARGRHRVPDCAKPIAYKT